MHSTLQDAVRKAGFPAGGPGPGRRAGAAAGPGAGAARGLGGAGGGALEWIGTALSGGRGSALGRWIIPLSK